MKRIISWILSMMLVLSMWPAGVVFAAEEFTVRGADAAATAGADVSVDIVLENNPGFCAINLYYVFNTDYFTLTEVENKVADFTMTHVTTTVWDAVSNFTEDATLGTLHFDVAEDTPAGEYEIEIMFLSAANDAFEDVVAQTASATVTVTEKGCSHEARTEVPYRAADCVTPGNYQYFICDDCGAAFKADGVTETTAEQEIIPANGHTWGDAACLTPKTCSVCGATEGSALGHSFSDGVCTRCGASENVDGPQIISQPVNYVGAVNDNVIFVVEATGEGLTYEWFYSSNGTTWVKSYSPGYNTNTLSPILRAYRDGYQFYCKVTDKNGNSMVSNVVSMTVKASEIVIVSQPADVENATLGQLYYYTVTATGDNLTYRWQVSTDGGETWAESWNQGYNTATLGVRMNANRDGNQYRCVVTSGLKIVAISDAAVLDMQDPSAEIITQPTSVYVVAGKTASFTVGAAGTDLTYLWYRSNDKGATWAQTYLSGYNTETLSFAATTNRAAMYMCKVTDGSGKAVWSSPVSLTILSAELKILTQPVSMTCASGETAVFTVEAQGDTLKYQWYASADNGATWTASYMTGYNTNEFSFVVNSSRAAKLYKCVITDVGGNTVETDAVSVTIG